MSTVNDLCQAMERIAPTGHAADWDNVGLLVGQRTAPCCKIMLTIDLTREVLTEAVSKVVVGVVA